MSEIRIGISGWRYAPWRKGFYPKGLRQDDELAFASRAVYCYFDNDQKVHAPYDARRLLGKLGLDGDLATEPGVPPEVQP